MVVAETLAVRVLLIDNASDRRKMMQTIIDSPALGAQVVAHAVDGPSAVDAVRESAPDVAVMEIQLPVEVGLELLDTLRSRVPDLPVVVCSFRHDRETKERAMEHGARSYLDKPVSPMDLGEAISRRAIGRTDDSHEVMPHA